MKTIKIDKTDIFIDDHSPGKGKITVSDPFRGAFTSSWGAMGGDLSEFLCSINADYFASNLTTNTYVFDGKQSAKNIRKHLRTEMYGELPWYKFMQAQMQMRDKINELERCSTGEEFVFMCNNLIGSIYIDSFQEEQEFKEIIESVFTSEPWNFIGEKHSPEYLWLIELHKKIKSELKVKKS